MAERPSGQDLLARVDRAFTYTMLASNGIGAAIVFVFLMLLLPVRHPPPYGQVLLFNLPTGLVYVAATAFVAPRWGRAIARPRLRWLVEDRDPTREEQRRALRGSIAQLKIAAAMWAVAALVFGAINAHFSPEIGANVSTGLITGGLVTCAISYLLGERALRPVTARALECGPPLRPVMPGVITRTVLAWGLATAVPVVAISDIAVGMIKGDTPRSVTTAWSLLFVAVVALAAGALAIVVSAKSIAEPLRSLRRALAEVEAGKTDVQVAVDDPSEIGLLQAGFNRMVAGLRERERLRDLFGRHVGTDVARRALESGIELGGEVREAAVVFVDIVASTTLAESTPPDEVVKRLNAFFTLVLAVVSDHGGWVNKFEGDAALCVFGVPTPLDDAAGCALAAARALQARIAAEGSLDAGIGVSAGEVVAGNIGAAERFEYTVIGDPVNEAARLTELAKDRSAGVLASERALERAVAEEARQWQAAGEALLRGRSQPTRLVMPARAAPELPLRGRPALSG